ncbi:MAG: discoidin domain-containing protein [Acetatifactor sp.]|nr:discoidin domain-containing protein [Acetatifactor sp.]
MDGKDFLPASGVEMSAEEVICPDLFIASASHNSEQAGRALLPGGEGWSSHVRIQSGQWFCIDMQEYRMVNGIVMDAGEGARTFPPRFHVQISRDGLAWESVYYEKYDGVRCGLYPIRFEAAAARFVRIMNTESYRNREFGCFYQDSERWEMKQVFILGNGSIHPPVICREPVRELWAGKPCRICWTAENPDGVKLHWSLDPVPEGACFRDGVLEWTPDAGQGGTWHLEAAVSDGRGGRDHYLAELVVKASVQAEAVYRIKVRSGDTLVTMPEAANVVSWELENGADWLFLSRETGVLRLAPGRAQEGVHELGLRLRGADGQTVISRLLVEVEPGDAPLVRSWSTSQDMSRKMTQGSLRAEASVSMEEAGGQTQSAREIFHISRSRVRQQVYGFGSSLDASSLYNLIHLSPAPRKRLMEALFHPLKGGNWNFFRICFGASDFAADDFSTYDDMPEGEEDMGLEHFSIRRDIARGYLDYLREIRRMNPEISFVASVWSPPAWMKTNRSLVMGGTVREECLPVLAGYYVKCIQAYEREGIPVYAVTTQNEPDVVQPYPTTSFTGEQQKRFVKLLRGKLNEAGLNTKVWIMDTNFTSAEEYGWAFLEDGEVRDDFDGVAFHDYGGEPETMGQMRDRYPEKTMHLTERSTYNIQGADRVIRYFRNGAQTYCAWLIFLDENGEPAIGPLNGADPVQPVRCGKGRRDDWYFTVDYYYYSQVARFVQKGARVLDCEYGSPDTVTGCAFLNPDKSVAVYLVNQTGQPQEVRVEAEEICFHDRIPPETAVTYLAGRW